MDCEQALALISAQMDHELPAAEREQLAAHLAGCDVCRSATEAFETQDAELRRTYAGCQESAAVVADTVLAHLPPASREARMDERISRRLGWALAVGGLAAGIALILYGLHYQPPRPRGERPGASTASLSVGKDYLIPRPAPAAVPGKSAVVGDRIDTRDGQRRRVTLPDGSVLYVNQNTIVRLDANRRLTLEKGEVFVQVAPRSPAEGTFVVRSPGREVAALGTQFAVRTDGRSSGVVVAQGKVQVNDVPTPLTAGQQLAPDSKEPAVAPRVSHLLDWTQELMAAADSPLVPRSAYAGGALIAVDPTGQEAKLSLRKYHIDVHIEDGFARTTIDQTYFNEGHWRMEGTFYFPLPPDASLSRLAMYVADGAECNLMEGGMAERDHARNVFEQILYTQRDPALLEWLEGNTFKMRVFPLEPRQEKRLILSYSQRLPTLYGRTSYRFPAGHSLQRVGEWSFHARVKGGAENLVTSPTHSLESRKDEGDLFLDARERNARLDRDLALELLDPRAPRNEMVRFSSAEHEGSRYLMVRYRPELPGQVQRQRRDWVFLFESSADRDPLLARAQIEVMRALLANAENDDTFAVLTAGTRVRMLTALQAVTPNNVQAALDELAKVHLIGALDLGQALDAAGALCKAAKEPYLVHLGSGIAAMGERREDLLARRIPDGTRYVGVAVGKRWSRGFMKQAAERSGGHFTQINPDEPIRWRGFELAATLNTPRLMNVQVQDPTGKASFLAFSPALAQGEEVCAVARLAAPERENAELALPPAVIVSGSLNGQPFRRELPVRDVAAKADYLPRTWAKLEIDRLLAADALKHKDAIIELSKAMYVITPFTSLLVLENEAMYEQFQVDRGRKDHWAIYPCPAKIPVVYEPDGRLAVDPRGSLADEKPSAEAVRNTVVFRKPPAFLKWAAPPENPEIANRLPRERPVSVPPERTFLPPLSPGKDRNLELASLRREPEQPIDPYLFRIREEVTVPGLIGGGYGMVASGGGGFGGLGGAFALGGGFGMGAVAAGGSDPDPLGPVERDPSATSPRGAGPTSADERITRLLAGQTTSIDPTLIRLPRRVGELADADDDRDEEPVSAAMSKLLERKWSKTDQRLMKLVSSYRQAPPRYQRPSFNHNRRLFTNLLAFAPGLNSSEADVQAVVEAEATPDLAALPGVIDPAACQLIEQARAAGWFTITLPAENGEPSYSLTLDGSGRYSSERRLASGLVERVVCDGKTLWHLYPQLGVGARRAVSRFHRAELAERVPWLVLPAEDLARGAELRCVNANTVAIIPHGTGRTANADGPGRPVLSTQLVFAKGRLIERRLVEMPGGKVHGAQIFAADGTVTRIDDAGKVVARMRFPVKSAAEPMLRPVLDDLVVLSMPWRRRDHVYQLLELNPRRRLNHADNRGYQELAGEFALDLLAAEIVDNNGFQARQVYQQCFARRGVRARGFYTLLASAGYEVCSDADFLRLLSARPDDPLLRYLALAGNDLYAAWHQHQGRYLSDRLASEPFFGPLAALNDLVLRCMREGAAFSGSAENLDEQRRAVAFIRRHADSVLGWALLCCLQAAQERNEPATPREADRQFHLTLARLWDRLAEGPAPRYSARYEQAQELLRAGLRREARACLLELYNETLRQGLLPPLGPGFRQVLQGEGSEPDEWSRLMRQTAAELAREHPRAVVLLAWQCRDLDDLPLANSLIADLLTRTADSPERLDTCGAVLAYLDAGNQPAEAERLVQSLLAERQYERHAALWRLAARLAEDRGDTMQALTCFEKALDIEFGQLPELIDLDEVRTDYARLLNRYQWLWHAAATLGVSPPSDLASRMVRAADRWRALDPAGSEGPCQSAARLLRKLGAADLAWEYLTTPLALQPAESKPWLGLAKAMVLEGDLDRADQAYAEAFQAEPTNAELLWERVQNLLRAGKPAAAEPLLRQLAEGDWQPRFQGLKERARWQVRGR
jgi:ferric-dicitrate binding protein FerR (iron transport regulator)/tetratricopeptide (TPR) repeat protein